MEQKRIKVRLTENSPYSEYGYYKRGDIGYIDGYVNGCAVIILENGKFAKAELRWIEVVNEEDKNTNTELAESEDERIRKDIIEFMRHQMDRFSDAPNVKKKYEYWIAWLEKQGEQKPKIEYVYHNFRIGDVIEPIKYNGHPVRVENIFGCSYNCVSDDGKHFLSLPIHRENEYKLTEQKPAEWSEEDEKMIDAIYSCVDSHYDGLAKTSLLIWLKSLRPQSSWKPSDEQMNALESAVSSLQSTALESLYQKLNKLM